MILNDPHAVAAADQFGRLLGILRAEFVGLSNIRGPTAFGDTSYFDLLAQGMEVTLTPVVEPILEAYCNRPSLETVQGGFPWACDHYPWPQGADGAHLAPLLQVNLVQLRPYVQVEFPDQLVQVWAEGWGMTVRTVPLSHARACQCAATREPYEGGIAWFKTRTQWDADWHDGDGPFHERPERSDPKSIVGFRFTSFALGEVSILSDLISAGQNVTDHDDFLSFDDELLGAEETHEREKAFNTALDELSNVRLANQVRESFEVGSFFRFPYANYSNVTDDVAQGWRPLFYCDENDKGLHIRALAALYVAYRQVGSEFEFMAVLPTRA